MSPLNKGPLMGPRLPPPHLPMSRLPLGMAMGGPRFNHRGPPMGMGPPPRLPPHPMRMGPPMPPMMFGRAPRIPPPMPPMMGPRGMRGPMMRPGPRAMIPPQGLPHMRPRYPGHDMQKPKNGGQKKANKLEELELKKPWMTDAIRVEIQKKNKLYAKAKKKKDAKEWEDFKDLRNKVTRMIRDAKNEYLAKNPDQAHLYENDEELTEIDDLSELVSDSDEEEDLIPYCETCDREFDSRQRLQVHLGEHQTCNIDGCTFTAHAKIVEKHVTMQHSSGLYSRIKKDDDVDKWKIERKRRYPTSERVKLKEAEVLEKRDRGEVVNSQQNRSQKRPAKENTRKNRRRKRVKHSTNVTNELPFETEESNKGVRPFRGINCLLEDSSKVNVVEEKEDHQEENSNPTVKSIEISDDESNRVEEVSLVPKINIGLVADYGSGSESDSPPQEIPIQRLEKTNEVPDSLVKQEEPKVPEPIKKSCAVEKPVSSALKSKNMKKTEKPENKQAENRKILQNPAKTRPTLLRKLLARDIQHERNAIFQCITYIAKNDFFD